MIRRISEVPFAGPLIHPAQVRIAANDRAYAGFAEYGLYEQTELGKSALISCLDGAAVLYGDISDKDELNSFLRIMSNSVFCPLQTAQETGLNIHKTVNVMKREIPAPSFVREAYPPFTTAQLYEALKNGTDGDIILSRYEPFAADFSLRWRKGAADAAVMSGQACAMCLNVTDTAALINGVAVSPDLRGTGLGRKAVLTLCERQGSKAVFVCCSDAVIGFYEKLGFIKIGEAAYCRF